MEKPALLRKRVAERADAGPDELIQDDTFFECEEGRLKLRVTPGGEGQLIFYRRANQAGPRESFYMITPVPAPAALRELLSLAYGQAGRVRKRRMLFNVGRTRVHLDTVEELGHFMELEVVLGAAEPLGEGMQEARALMDELGVGASQWVEESYVDLLARREKRGMKG